MEKLKILINGNEYVANQAKGFFSELGYHISKQNRNNSYGWSLGDGVGDYYVNKIAFDSDSGKEVTIDQLRDLVALKRNDPSDATHDDGFSDVWFIDSDYKHWMFENSVWREAKKPLFELKPIKKEEVMKEFLARDESGIYFSFNSAYPKSSEWIEIPEGAKLAVRPVEPSMIYFFNDDNYYCEALKIWTEVDFNGYMKNSDCIVVWQREKTEVDNVEIDSKAHSHYFKDVSNLEYIDVYRVLDLFGVTDPCVQHAVKKLLCSGKRGTKDTDKDIQEAIDSLNRFKEMRDEDARS